MKTFFSFIFISTFLNVYSQFSTKKFISNVLTPNENVAIVYGDIDNDNDIDYASSLKSGEIYWFNNTDSSFTYFSPQLIGNSLNLNSSIDYLILEDINNDNNLDLIQVELSSKRIYTYVNSGLGIFTTPIMSYISNLPYTNSGILKSEDVNGDGLKDLIGGDNYSFWWVQNMGNGIFSNATLIPSNSSSLFDFDFIDLDNDNDVDLIVTFNSNQTSKWMENDGNGIFNPHVIIGMRGEKMTFTDVDGDSNLDIITFGHYNVPYMDWYEYVSDSTFTKQILSTDFDMNYNDYPISIYCKDINNDLEPDIVLTHSRKSMIFENLGNLVLNTPTVITESPSTAYYINDAFVEDYNLDGNLDIFTSQYNSNSAEPFLIIGWNENLGNDLFNEITYLKTNFTVYHHSDIQVYDIDNDGDNDIFGNEHWLENNGNEIFRIKTYFENSISYLSYSPKYPSDMDNDGDKDLVFFENFSGIYWYENNGFSEFNILHHQPNLPFRFKEIKLIDFDNDNDDDLIAIVQDTSTPDNEYKIISIINDNGVYNLQQTLFIDADFILHNLRLEDFNNDGNIDILYLQDSSPLQNLSIIFGSENGSFSNSVNTISQSSQHIIRVEPALIDSDNWIDYIALYQDSVSWFSNIGGTATGNNQLIQAVNVASNNRLEITHGDFNSNGYQDVSCIEYAHNAPDSLTCFFNSGNGIFSNSLDIVTNPNLGEIYAKDIDNDGDIDILAFGKSFYKNFSVSWFQNEINSPTPIVEYQYLNICDNDSVFIHDQYIYSTGIFIDSLQTIFGADSIHITNLTVNLPSEVNISHFSQDTLCFTNQIIQLPEATPNGGVFKYNGDTITTFDLSNASIGENQITYVFTNSNGCINSDTTYLTVNQPSEVNLSPFIQDTLCFGNQIVQLPIATPNGGIYEYNSDTITTFNLVDANIGENLITYVFTDPNNCTTSDSTSITILDCLNLKNNSVFGNIIIYPNPSSNTITINLQSETNDIVFVELLDINQKTVYKTSTLSTSKTQINLTNMSAGIYYIKLSLKEEVYVKQIIKI